MLPSRPYLLRAMHEWIVDSGLTPHLLINADDPGLRVPDAARQDDRVVLNISPTAVRDLLMDADLVTFVARFGGVSQAVSVPMAAVEGIYARENGRGMMFPDEEGLDSSPESDGRSEAEGDDGPERPRSRPSLKVVK
ncbi:ClpXP protease specificity-enhancing factor [Wenzhouxiangella marina]|uniref:Stringent starvation protein B n=1 Tax=Wenzhouxiangella marina TaxID=1579979 RepID=A0A0K0XVE3_9GAMM|nr:ClpXP protease specificity-enhancing factor [Wenzhouxiangella marina]AKS41679.1 Stringent starvation protein B [Wenzhouxiangella marina]